MEIGGSTCFQNHYFVQNDSRHLRKEAYQFGPSPRLRASSKAFRPSATTRSYTNNTRHHKGVQSTFLPHHTQQKLTPLQAQKENCVALDCEMVGVGRNNTSVLARVSIVDFWGKEIFDTFVKVEEKITDYRTEVSGIKPEDLVSSSALSYGACRVKVMKLLRGKILVGHDLKNDLKVLRINHSRRYTRDTSQYEPFMRKQPDGSLAARSLKTLSLQFFGNSIQDGEHCSLEDAKAAMQLYALKKEEFDASVESNAQRVPPPRQRISFDLPCQIW